MDDVKVHYNSSQPAQLNAHAYAQGNQIHIAPGQEKHLPHEAWHVVQQKQGRVKPTRQMKGKVNINDDVALEKEADVMGRKAASSFILENRENLQLVSKNNSIDKPFQLAIRIDEGHGMQKEFTVLGMLEHLQNHYPNIVTPQTQRDIRAIDATNPIFATWAAFIHELITSRDHNLEASMRGMVGNGMQWGHPAMPGGPPVMERRKPFYNWLHAAGAAPTHLNCWEGVLYAAFHAGYITKARIINMVDQRGGPGGPRFVHQILANAAVNLVKPAVGPIVLPAAVIPRGMVVLFGGNGEHVALSTGNLTGAGQHEILEIDNDTGGVIVSTVEQAAAKKGAYGGRISWGRLP